MHLSTKQLTRPSNRSNRRDGIVLLVVIAMLALFATVGLSFVYYSESVALTARYNRISVTSDLRDIPPDRIMSRILSDILFDTDDIKSQFYGLSLGRNMYGGPGGRFAFSGTGYDPIATVLSSTSVSATRKQIKDTAEFALGRGNAPYTFPDINNPYLGWIDENGKIQARSYFRGGQPLRATLYTPPSGWPAGEGDVRNLEGASGITDFTQTQSPPNYVNDSFWMDPNYTFTTKEGLTCKILVAPFLLDLDGRVNLSTAGTQFTAGNVTSRGGIGPWEINPIQLFATDNTLKGQWPSLLRHGSFPSKFGTGIPPVPLAVLPTPWFNTAPIPSGGSGPAYSRFPINGSEANFNFNAGLYSPFPTFPGAWSDQVANQKHAAMFDYHNSNKSVYNVVVPSDRRFAISNMEAFLRYGESGTTGVTSDILRNMPGLDLTGNASHQNLRNLITTASIAVDVPHLPAFFPAAGSYKVTPPAANNNATPATALQNLMVPLTAPMTTQFSATYPLDAKFADPMLADSMMANSMCPTPLATAAASARFNLNQPTVNSTVQASQILAVMCNMLGLPVPTTDPNKKWTYNAGSNTYTDKSNVTIDIPAYKYLAQIAVNLVDSMDIDNNITMLNWSNQQNSADDYVFGVEQPRLVLNEAYASFDNDYQDMKDHANDQTKATFYRLNVFVEFLNPSPNPLAGPIIPLDLTQYQILVVKDLTGMDKTSTGLPSNTGTPTNTVIDTMSGTSVKVKVLNPPANTLPPNASAPATNGFLVMGPILSGDMNNHDTFPDSRRPVIQQPPPAPVFALAQDPALSIKLSPKNGDTSMGPDTTITPTVILQRLVNPGAAEQPDPKMPNYNPYVTVDFFENIPVNNSIIQIGKDQQMPQGIETFSSYGRKQPLKAYPLIPNDPSSAVVAQSPIPAPMAMSNIPKNTFGRHNYQNTATPPAAQPGDQTLTLPFDWFVFLDRPLVNRGELMTITTCTPPTLTHQIGAANTTLGEAMNSPNTLLARLMEAMFVPSFEYNPGVYANGAQAPGSANMRQPMMRVPGKINLNMASSQKILEALFDPQSDSNFAKTDVDNFYTTFDSYRKGTFTLSAAPGIQNAPPSGPMGGFSDYSYAPLSNGQKPAAAAGSNPTPLIQPRGGLLQLIAQSSLSSGKVGYKRDEALRKIANNVSFTSNMFAVWLTVGFFEVRTTPASGNTPASTQLVELFSEDNRQIRHRMFAIVDRSQLVMPAQDLGVTVQNVNPGSGLNAFFPVLPKTSYPSLDPNTVNIATTTLSWELSVDPVGGPAPGVPSLTGRVAVNYPDPVGLVEMDWKFTKGATVQVGTPGNWQTGHIINVFPKPSRARNTIEVAFPYVNGNPPTAPASGASVRFPDPITMMAQPFQDLLPAGSLPATPSLQYGYPGPQPRFSAAENPHLVPYYTIID
jgi:hypothetical protein